MVQRSFSTMNSLASAKDKYRLAVGGFKGTTTDPMKNHNRRYFSTKDDDNDNTHLNCALIHGPKEPMGGWWYDSCYNIAPNIIYNRWYGMELNSQYHTLPYIEIKVRPHNCNI